MVNTFLPYWNFELSAKCLDYRRLGKQRVEAKQIIDVLEHKDFNNMDVKLGWRNHPAVLMWKGYIEALKLYFNFISKEWVSRGYKHNMGFYIVDENVQMPWRLGNEDFHYSHQASLIRKKDEYYKPLFTNIPDKYISLGYVWPKIKDGACTIEFAPIT